jgi:hypothetical protein
MAKKYHIKGVIFQLDYSLLFPITKMEVFQMEQKLVTLYLKHEDRHGGFFRDHGIIEEHMGSYLDKGWKIATITPVSGKISTWIIVKLEK